MTWWIKNYSFVGILIAFTILLIFCAFHIFLGHIQLCLYKYMRLPKWQQLNLSVSNLHNCNSIEGGKADEELILSDYLLSIDLYSITLLSLKRRSCAKINFEFMKTSQPVKATNYSKCQMRLRQDKPQTEKHKQKARQTLSQHDKSHKSVIITTLCSQLVGFRKSESYLEATLHATKNRCQA